MKFMIKASLCLVKTWTIPFAMVFKQVFPEVLVVKLKHIMNAGRPTTKTKLKDSDGITKDIEVPVKAFTAEEIYQFIMSLCFFHGKKDTPTSLYENPMNTNRIPGQIMTQGRFMEVRKSFKHFDGSKEVLRPCANLKVSKKGVQEFLIQGVGALEDPD
eukprot:Nk52_evm19s1763 gene=Nk52_evmTU19s1763